MTAPTKPDLSQITVDDVRDQLIQITYDVAQAHDIPVGSLDYAHVARRLGLDAFTCVNMKDDQPACLVGQWLVRHAGATQQEFDTNGIVQAGSYEALRILTNVPGNSPVREFLSGVQAAQDNGQTWLKAIQGAYDVYKRWEQ